MAEREALRDEPLPRRGRRQTLAQPHDPAGHRRSPDREPDALARASEGWLPGHGVPLEAGRRKRRSDTCRRGAGPMKIKRVDHLGVIVGDLEGAVQSLQSISASSWTTLSSTGTSWTLRFFP